MEPKQLIEAIKVLGGNLSENEIARRLRDRGRRVSQSTINRIVNDECTNPSYRTVKALQELHADLARTVPEPLAPSKGAALA